VSVERNISSGLIEAGFAKMTRLNVVIAPWLTIGETADRLKESQQRQLERFAHELFVLHPNGTIFWFAPDITPLYRERAFFETLLSTASYLSYQRLGTLVVTDEMIWVAHRLVEEFIREDDGSILLSVHARVMTYLNGQVLAHYHGVLEQVFISGAWHRPWINGTLKNELERGIADGLFCRELRDGESFVTLTDKGFQLYEACRDDLEQCGYLKLREQLMRTAVFTNMDDYEPMMDQMNPIIHQNRRLLLNLSGIDRGMKVLELGCGAGALTLDDGLCNLVAPTGHVVATDPSIGMLERAKQKREKYDARNVEFRQAAAEDLPFSDETFDAVIGFLFLHFTDIPKALREIQRVTKPGGTFSTLYGLHFSSTQSFFMEWFEPVFTSALMVRMPHVMPNEDFVPSVAGEYFTEFTCNTEEFVIDLSNVEHTVKFFVEAGPMANLGHLPWRARHELFDELIRRGYMIKEKYGENSMKLIDRGQWFHGVVRK
jgi:ubiquinone/menaquinone biosynthesis C-methylase UbiE